MDRWLGFGLGDGVGVGMGVGVGTNVGVKTSGLTAVVGLSLVNEFECEGCIS